MFRPFQYRQAGGVRLFLGCWIKSPEIQGIHNELRVCAARSRRTNPVGRTRWCWSSGLEPWEPARVSGLAGQPGTYIRWNFYAARLAQESIAGAEGPSENRR